MTASTSSIELAKIAALAADDKLGEAIAVVDVSQQLVITDCFVIVTGDNERHVGALIDEIDQQLSDKAGVDPVRREGVRDGRWGLLDYGDIVVHVFRRQEREFYGLDRLWQDCPLVEIEGVETYTRPSTFTEGSAIRHVESLDEIPLAAAEPDENEL